MGLTSAWMGLRTSSWWDFSSCCELEMEAMGPRVWLWDEAPTCTASGSQILFPPSTPEMSHLFLWWNTAFLKYLILKMVFKGNLLFCISRLMSTIPHIANSQIPGVRLLLSHQAVDNQGHENSWFRHLRNFSCQFSVNTYNVQCLQVISILENTSMCSLVKYFPVSKTNFGKICLLPALSLNIGFAGLKTIKITENSLFKSKWYDSFFFNAELFAIFVACFLWLGKIEHS